MRTYSKWTCSLCERQISSNGLATISHLRKHVREGLMVETTLWGKIHFKHTGEGEKRYQELYKPWVERVRKRREEME